jgi:hypothetical protein
LEVLSKSGKPLSLADVDKNGPMDPHSWNYSTSEKKKKEESVNLGRKSKVFPQKIDSVHRVQLMVY